MIMPIIQPIVLAIKSNKLQNLLMKRYFCSSSVMPLYANVANDIDRNIFFL